MPPQSLFPDHASPSATDYLLKFFAHSPTPQQQQLFQKLSDFVVAPDGYKTTFLLRGYAGTGKTSMIKALAKTLRKFNYRVVLLAPTGRAAKVVAQPHPPEVLYHPPADLQASTASLFGQRGIQAQKKLPATRRICG